MTVSATKSALGGFNPIAIEFFLHINILTCASGRVVVELIVVISAIGLNLRN